MATEKQIIKLLDMYSDAAEEDSKEKPEKCTTREMSLYLITEIELIKNDIKRINKGEITL